MNSSGLQRLHKATHAEFASGVCNTLIPISHAQQQSLHCSELQLQSTCSPTNMWSYCSQQIPPFALLLTKPHEQSPAHYKLSTIEFHKRVMERLTAAAASVSWTPQQCKGLPGQCPGFNPHLLHAPPWFEISSKYASTSLYALHQVDAISEALMPSGVRGLRSMFHATAVEVLLYLTPVHCQDMLDSLTTSLNATFTSFMRRNPAFKVCPPLTHSSCCT